jgi:tetratricopeptide (TPR) repeat protein/DNA-binding MarR family transcriptional regulator
MSNQDTLISIENRILLHILSYQGSKSQYKASTALTQTGIAQAVGANRSYISRAVKKSLDKGLIQENIGRVDHRIKKQKYYLLTDRGKEHTQKFKKNLSNLKIKLEHPHGVTEKMRVNDLFSYLDIEKICPDITELDLYNTISKHGIVEIEKLKKIKKVQFYDFSADAPIIVHFFGRKKELTLLKKWVEDREGHNTIFLYGMPGIGKTTLAVKLLETYRGSKHIFWHNFYELDTLRGVLFKLAEFLSKLGYDQLKLHLRTRTNLDYYEVSKILEKSIGNIDAILIFDNFQKSNDKIRTFFNYIYRMLTSSSKTKMLILSRKILSIHEEIDIRAEKIIAKLELSGLDFESSKRLLKEKGIDRGRVKEMYKIIAGNPLFLEILGGSKDLLEKYIHDELFSKLDEDERKILGIISIYRIPVPEDCLTTNEDIDFEKFYGLTQKSIVKKDARGQYFLHDIIKDTFYNRLSSSVRKKHHLFAARWYESSNVPLDLIEGLYHYLQGEEYDKAFQCAVDSSTSIFEGGYVTEFLVILERFNEKFMDTGDWAELLILKGKACYMSGEWEKALDYFTRSTEIASTIGDKKLKVKAIYESGFMLEEQNDLEKASDYFKRCVEISEKEDYSLGTGNGYRGIGRIHWRKSEHDEAIKNFEKCQEIFERLKESKLIASTYIDLGNVYDERYEAQKAIECYNKSLDILKKIDKKQEMARAYSNLAITYKHLEEFDKAIEYNTKLLTLAENLGDVKASGYGYAQISYCFAKKRELKKASKYVKKAEKIASIIDSKNIMFDALKTHALICKHEKKWDEAIDYFRKSIKIVEDPRALYYLSDSYFELGILYKEMDDTENAEKSFNIAEGLYDMLGLRNTELVKKKLSKYRLGASRK